jgi:hypothetical protein
MEKVPGSSESWQIACAGLGELCGDASAAWAVQENMRAAGGDSGGELSVCWSGPRRSAVEDRFCFFQVDISGVSYYCSNTR